MNVGLNHRLLLVVVLVVLYPLDDVGLFTLALSLNLYTENEKPALVATPVSSKILIERPGCERRT
jgi:hypothetical protein